MDEQTSYRARRQAVMDINQRLTGWASTESLQQAARFLNMWHDEQAIFRSEVDLSILMDFMIYEPIRAGRSVVQVFSDEATDLSFQEREVLQVMLTSKRSLYRVEQCWPNRSQVRIHDVLNDEADDMVLTDSHLSQTAPEGLLLFSRILQFNEVAMSTGAMMGFPVGMEGFLKRKAAVLNRTLRHIPSGCRPVAVWFRLFRSWGLPTGYEDVQP